MLKVALAVLVACGGVLAYELLRPREYFTGTNNAGSSGPVFHVDPGHELCIPGLAVPKGTAHLRLQLAPLPATDVQYRVGAASGTAHVDATGGPGGSTPARLDVPAVGSTLCIKPSGPIDVAGRPQRFAGQPAPALDGHPAAGVAAVWFEPPPGQRRSLLAQLPDIAHRAALFRPGIIGAWTYWLLLLAVPIAVLVAAIRLCLRPTRRAALWVGLIAFVAAASWSLLTPILNAPDELEHVSYAQAIAEQGRGPSAAPSRRRPYSTEAQAAYEGARLPGEYRQLLGRPPWTRAYEANWRARDAHARGDDGGGWTTVAGYTPAYYAAVAPAYLAAKPWSFWSRVTALRLMTALMAAVAAFFTVLCVRELLPRHEWAAVAAGLFVALQPMVSFMAGMVNNDAAVIMLGAAALYLVARGLRRGLTPWLAFALGAVAVAAPMAKGNGIFLLPAIAVGIAGMVLRGRRPPPAPLAGGVVASLAAFVLLAAALHHSADPTNPGWYASTGSAFPTLPGAPVQPSKALDEPVRFAEYLWEMVLPPVAGMPDLRTGGVRAPAFQAYVIRGWGAFAFAVVQFPKWVYVLICVVLAGLLGLGLALLRRTGVRGHGWEIAVLLVAVVGVVLGTEVAYYSPKDPAIPEFGRYLFPAATAFAAMAAAALLGARRHAAALGAGLVAALGILWVSGLWATAAQLYT